MRALMRDRKTRGTEMNELNTIGDAAAFAPHGPGRRKEERKRLIYRLVQIEHEGDQGLARCRNISESGLKLELTMNVTLDARMTVAFSDAHVFAGTVIWRKGGHCGVHLDEPVDYDAMLRASAAAMRRQGHPGLRLARGLTAVLRCDGRTRPMQVSEVTQHGLKLMHDGDLHSSLQLGIRFGVGRERQGIVRWSDGKLADVVLLEPFSVGELGSLAALDAMAAGTSKVWAL